MLGRGGGLCTGFGLWLHNFRFGLAVHREIQRELGALILDRVDKDIAASLFDDPVGGRQTKTCPLAGAFGGVEGFKHLLQFVRRDPDPFVRDLHGDPVTGGHNGAITLQRFVQNNGFRLNPDFTALRHRIACVHHKVHQHLLQLALVRPDRAHDRIMA